MYISEEAITVSGKAIGDGNFSTVCHGIYNDKPVALKVFKNTNSHVRQSVEKEVEILMQLNHPNIITCYGYTEKSNLMMIVMQDGGITLDEYIKEKYNTNNVDVKSVIQDLLQICQAISYLYSHSISHGDISLRNILVDKEGIIRLCDFGSAKVHPINNGFTQYIHENQPICTPIFGAPERYGGDKRYPVVDVYSFGMVALSFYKNGSPYTKEELNVYEQIHSIERMQHIYLLDVQRGFRPTIPSSIPEKLRKLIDECLQFDGYNARTGEETWRPGIYEVENRLRSILLEYS